MEAASLAGVLLIALLLRCTFLSLTSNDDHVHLFMAHLVKQFGLRRAIRHPTFHSLPQGLLVNQVIPFWILTRFPRNCWVRVGRYLNIGYDIASTILVYLVAKYWLLAAYDDARILGQSPALVAALLFTTTPVLFPVTARLLSMGARTLGTLTSLLYFLALGYGMVHGSPIALVVASFFVLVSIHSSKFGFQATVLMSFGLAGFSASWTPILVVVAPLVIGALIPQLGVRELLIHRVHHMRWYLHNLSKTAAANRNTFHDLRKIPYYLSRRWCHPHLIHVLLEKNTFFIAIVSVPCLLVLGIYWLVQPSAIQSLLADPTTAFLLNINLATLAVFVLTSFRPFLILGEAERYLSYSIAFLFPLLMRLLIDLDGTAAIVLCLLFAHSIAIVIHYSYAKKQQRQVGDSGIPTSSMQELVAYLQPSAGRRILTIPTKMAFRLAHETPDADAQFYFDFVMDMRSGFAYMDEATPNYLYPRPDFEYFVDNYHINTIVVHRSALTNGPYRDQYRVALTGLACDFENDQFLVYQLDQNRNALDAAEMKDVSTRQVA